MKSNKIKSAKKQLENILSNCETVGTIGKNNALKSDNFYCEFHESLTKDDLLKRAAAFDRACYHEKKTINGGLAVQAAIAFILNHKENAKQIEIKASYKNVYSYAVVCCSWFAYLGAQKLCAVGFNDKDYNYALDMMRI